ncbi:hypothetical protein OA855_00835 [Pelagibacteraceae bacterium]|nr:hypothetical protein [Pelagibacteraceae bacterium]MDC3156325.1 hypothetical protein [Pelagibacteraceae bacterium]
MEIILKEIVAIIKEETENINKKIYGTTFLEILKEKILNRQDRLSLKKLQIQNSNIELKEKININEKNLIFKLSFYQNPKSILKFKLNKNFLLIVFNELVKIDILNQNSQKYINVGLKPFMGVTLSKGTVCNLNFPKNSIIMQLETDDVDFHIEKKQDETI